MGSTNTPAPSGSAADLAQRPHIVVVNDTQEILDLFREILEDEGYAVTLYSFAINDLSELLKLRPDLVILDFLIGGESLGWQLLQKMKMDRRTAHIPVIVCSAALQLLQELEGHLRAKNVGIVVKPFDIDELVDIVQQYLASGPARTPELPGAVPDPASARAD